MTAGNQQARITQAPPVTTREALVQATSFLLRRTGYYGTGLREILALSGCPKGSLYHYFPGGKDELVIAAIEVAGHHEGIARAAAAAYDSWIAEVRDFLRTSLGLGEEAALILAEAAVAMLEGALILARARRSPEALHRTGLQLRRLLAPYGESSRDSFPVS